MTDASTAEFDAFAEALLAEGHPRSLIILGAAKADYLLLDILRKRLLPKSAKSKDPDELLESDNPVATFSSRIKLCFRVGAIDDTLFRCLERLRKLRNPSAHWISFDLDKDELRSHYRELHSQLASRESYKLLYSRFFDGETPSVTINLQACLLTICFLLCAIREGIEPLVFGGKTQRIAAK